MCMFSIFRANEIQTFSPLHREVKFALDMDMF